MPKYWYVMALMDNPSKSLKITVLGAGSWGTALARLLARKGYPVKLWAYEKEVAEGINKEGRNPLYLSEIKLPKSLKATSDMAESLDDTNLVVSVIPSHVLRSQLNRAKDFIPREAIVVSCTKGLETDTGKLISEVLAETLPHIDPHRFTFLSGPSFAIEVAKDLPTTVVIAGTDPEVTKTAQHTFHTDTFLVFTHSDTIGVELGGAIKNVIAIAAGASDGLGFGSNSRAALITRGLYEMIKVGKPLGANPFTFTGLSGMGDLILTCTSTNSRNYTLGLKLGKGMRLNGVLSEMKMVAEGVKTAHAIYKVITENNINAPICKEVYYILYKGKSPREAAFDLTHVELHEEFKIIL